MSHRILPCVRAMPALERDRLLAVILAPTLPDQLRRGDAEIVLDHVRELDAPQVRDIERIGGGHQRHRGWTIGFGFDRARRGLDRAYAIGRRDREAVARAAIDRERGGQLIAVELRGPRALDAGRARRERGLDDELGGLRRHEHARVERDLRAGQPAHVARRRRQAHPAAGARVRGERQGRVEIADERHEGQVRAVVRRRRRGHERASSHRRRAPARPRSARRSRRARSRASAPRAASRPSARAARDRHPRHAIGGRVEERADERGRRCARPRGRVDELDRRQQIRRDRRVARRRPSARARDRPRNAAAARSRPSRSPTPRCRARAAPRCRAPRSCSRGSRRAW